MKILYNKQKKRLRLSLKVEDCRKHKVVPDQLCKAIEAPFISELQENTIDFFETRIDILIKVWEILHETKDHADDQEFILSLASAAKRNHDIEIFPSDDPKINFFISYSGDSETLAKLGYEHLRLNVVERLKEEQIPNQFHPGHLFSVFRRITLGLKPDREPIGIFTSRKARDPELGYEIVANRSRCEAYLLIDNHRVFKDAASIHALISECRESVFRYSEKSGISLEFLEEDLLSRIIGGIRGADSLGINLPSLYLIAQEPSHAQLDRNFPKAKKIHSTPEQDGSENKVAQEHTYSGKGILKISGDRMKATIKDFDMNVYKLYQLDELWLKNEIERLQLDYDLTENNRTKIIELMQLKKDLSGSVISEGTLPIAAREPYLFASFQEKSISNSNADTVDFRELQQRMIVNKGDRIAEIRYKKPAIMGSDIYGMKLPAPASEDVLQVTLGEGILEKPPRVYIATKDGIPKIDGNEITLSEILVHEGDVNLKTGNIRFNQSATITGSIDSGSSVDIGGDLLVAKEVRDAYVRVAGNLTVGEGVVTGRLGLIVVKGDFQAKFIENSNIYVDGNLTVEKVILNSNIYCLGSIRLETQKGLISGGTIYCQNELITGSLAMKQGSITKLYMGIDWKIKRSVIINEERYASLMEKEKECQKTMRELNRKNSTFPQKTITVQIEDLKKRIQRYKALIQKTNEKIQAKKSMVKLNRDTRVQIVQNLSTNCKVEIAGNIAPVNQEISGVEITTKKTNGSYIRALEEKEDKKAS